MRQRRTIGEMKEIDAVPDGAYRPDQATDLGEIQGMRTLDPRSHGKKTANAVRQIFNFKPMT